MALACDKYLGQGYEHRRGWVEKRLLFLSIVFAIDICTYAVMSNHSHVVVCIDKAQADGWDAEEVLRRLHKGTLLSQKKLTGEDLSPGELITFDDTLKHYQQRLYDISW